MRRNCEVGMQLIPRAGVQTLGVDELRLYLMSCHIDRTAYAIAVRLFHVYRLALRVAVRRKPLNAHHHPLQAYSSTCSSITCACPYRPWLVQKAVASGKGSVFWRGAYDPRAPRLSTTLLFSQLGHNRLCSAHMRTSVHPPMTPDGAKFQGNPVNSTGYFESSHVVL